MVRARTDIKAGEELFAAYGTSYKLPSHQPAAAAAAPAAAAAAALPAAAAASSSAPAAAAAPAAAPRPKNTAKIMAPTPAQVAAEYARVMALPKKAKSQRHYIEIS